MAMMNVDTEAQITEEVGNKAATVSPAPHNVAFLSWAASCSRSDNIARELGGRSHKIYWGWLGSHPATVWLKYLGQFFATQRILWRERPDAVFVMIPPLFAALAALPYCRLRRKPLVQDAHTAAFLHPRWRRLQRLQGWLCRKAATTIVTNSFLADKVEQFGGHATIVRDVPVVYEVNPRFRVEGEFTVAAVCSFNYDEPIAEIFAAARELPEVRFYVTGNPADLDAQIAEQAPPNVTLTGFLPDADYGALLQRVDIVLTLTTRDHTMLRGAYEAVYLGTPVIISDWPILREAFPSGALHVDNSAAGIAAAIRTAQNNLAALREEVQTLRSHKLAEWQQKKEQLLSLLPRG